jgi:sec-independent protein translocase protein TatB
MFGMGMGEILLILVVALLALGPDKLPAAAKAIGKGIRDLRRQTHALQSTIEQDTKLGEAVRVIKSALREDPSRPRPRPPPTPPIASTETQADDSDDGTDSSGSEVGSEGDSSGDEDSSIIRPPEGVTVSTNEVVDKPAANADTELPPDESAHG